MSSESEMNKFVDYVLKVHEKWNKGKEVNIVGNNSSIEEFIRKE